MCPPCKSTSNCKFSVFIFIFLPAAPTAVVSKTPSKLCLPASRATTFSILSPVVVSNCEISFPSIFKFFPYRCTMALSLLLLLNSLALACLFLLKLIIITKSTAQITTTTATIKIVLFIISPRYFFLHFIY